MNKKLIWGIVGVIIVILLTIGVALNKSNTGTVKIVALYPLTGGVASWGESSQRGTQVAVDEINKAGGVNGKQLEVTYQDHKCDPKTALSIFEQSVSTSKIFILSSCSGTVLSIAPNLKKNDALLLATVVASVKISSSSPLVFRNWAVETRQANLVGQKIKDLGFKKVGVIYEQTDFGKGLALGLENYLKDSGINLESDSFAPGATDVRTQLTKFKADKVQAIFIAPQTETSGEVVLSQMEQIGFKPQLFVNDIILGAPNLIAKHKDFLEGALGGNFLVRSDKLQSFLDEYKTRYGTDCAHITACAVAYDSIYMLADSLKTTNSAQGVAEYLRNINYSGIAGDTSFDSNNDRSGVGYLLSVIKSGNVELVK